MRRWGWWCRLTLRRRGRGEKKQAPRRLTTQGLVGSRWPPTSAKRIDLLYHAPLLLSRGKKQAPGCVAERLPKEKTMPHFIIVGRVCQGAVFQAPALTAHIAASRRHS